MSIPRHRQVDTQQDTRDTQQDKRDTQQDYHVSIPCVHTFVSRHQYLVCRHPCQYRSLASSGPSLSGNMCVLSNDKTCMRVLSRTSGSSERLVMSVSYKGVSISEAHVGMLDKVGCDLQTGRMRDAYVSVIDLLIQVNGQGFKRSTPQKRCARYLQGVKECTKECSFGSELHTARRQRVHHTRSR